MLDNFVTLCLLSADSTVSSRGLFRGHRKGKGGGGEGGGRGERRTNKHTEAARSTPNYLLPGTKFVLLSTGGKKTVAFERR
eukprot:2772154-Pyramimonas_sp.AAC.1